MDETIRQAGEIERWCQSRGVVCAPNTRPSRELSEQIRGLWERAPDWPTLIELNRRYLQRRLPVCAGYPSPPDGETDLFTNLLRLHDFGIISTNSCPGWEDHVKYFPTFARQRAFLTFSIPTRIWGSYTPTTLCNFVQQLLTSQELYAFIRFQYNNAPDGVERDSDVNGLMEYGYCCNFPDSRRQQWRDEDWAVATNKDDKITGDEGTDDEGTDDEGIDDEGTGYNVANEDDVEESTDSDDEEASDDEEMTGFYVSQEQRRQASQAWTHYGVSAVYLSGSDFKDDDNPFPGSHEADPLQISIYAKDWNYRGIGQLMERLLINSGIVPGFMARG